ncbi:proline-rich extensin-like protein EPR1 isoform X2 [Quercus robur]|uniref:proline-rich extensin-like protein EPR1 isoform X2 n=1 Tax=Quercus robur TaxID=38942 RepID=UPI00216355A7|nr:proline-rich extensin-like protein EPR1 isoform X2 [Quercus robur]
MSWIVIIFFLSLAFNSLSEAGHEKKLPSAIVVGSVYCDTCFQEDFSKSSHFISGASVAVECKYGTSKPSFHKEVKTDQHGEFKVHLPFSVSKHVKKIEGCSVKLISSSEPYCAVASTATSSSLHLKSRKQGTHIFSAGFFTFKPLKQPNLCNQKPSIQNSKELGSNKLSLPPTDGLDFPPPIQDPTSPYLPPLPKLPELPPLPLLPPLPNLPGLPFPPPNLGKTTNSKPTTTESLKKTQLQDEKEAHPDDLFPPLLTPVLPPIQDPTSPYLPPLPKLPELPPLPQLPPLPNLPGLPFPPPNLGKTTNSKPTTTESLKKTQLQDKKEAHPDDLFPPLLTPVLPPIQDPTSPYLPPLPKLPELPPLPLLPPLPNLPPLPLLPPLPNIPGLPFPPPNLGKTTNSKPTTTESLKKTQLQDEKEAHPDDLFPPLLTPILPPIQDPTSPYLPPLPKLPELPPLPLLPPLPNLPPLPLLPPLPNIPGLPFPPPNLGKTTNSKPTTTKSLKKTQLQDEKEAHPDNLFPPLLPPLFPPLLPPNPFQPSPLIPNPFQPPPLIPNPFQPPPAPLLPSPPAGPAPLFPFPPIPGLTPSPPPPALPFPFPPIVPLPPIPRIPGIPPAPSSKQISSP